MGEWEGGREIEEEGKKGRGKKRREERRREGIGMRREKGLI